MSGFDQLHPAVQHHVVNSLGWKSLRPLQDDAVGPVLAGEHALLLAPTAGGKTEAAAFPVFSRMLSEDWRGLSVLYLCPIKALLNNLEVRLQQYASYVGRRVGLWHGDVKGPVRNRLVRDPPDLLLTTPESVEVMLTSTRVDHRALLGNVQTIVVDELHAFAGDDRGWHLLALAERLCRVAGRDIQRLGLSATVGNPDELLDWFRGGSGGARRVVAPPAVSGAASEPDITLDYVASIENAANVISRLHRGEKRLVFCDSRARVERLANALRARNVPTYVSHSSLSADERQRAEEAFATQRDAVIVATSTLELGIDVGDLDRVIQIDSPGTVASFLQRLGRTGRRAGSQRNCLFLATRQSAFLQAAGLLRLWRSGFVEPIQAPALPYHILAQQLMALVLQERGVGRHTWTEWLGGLVARMGAADAVEPIVTHMLETGILAEDGAILGFGEAGEKTFGWRHFMELMTVFTGDPLFVVRHGREELGYVHPLSFSTRGDGPAVLLLAGRGWAVRHVDWARQTAQVEPSPIAGRSQWLGSAGHLSGELCRSVREVLAGDDVGVRLTKRGDEALDEARDEFGWADSGKTSLVRDSDGSQRWWTFAGGQANVMLRAVLGDLRADVSSDENFAIGVSPQVTAQEITLSVTADEMLALELPIDDELVDGLKFSACLPRALAAQALRARQLDLPSCRQSVREQIGTVSMGE